MRTQLKELLILHFLNDGIRTTIIVLLPLIATDLSLSLTFVGFLGSSQPLIGAFLALPTGYILGKFGGYKVILTLLLVYSAGVLIASIATNAPLLLLSYLLAALGFGMFHPAGFALTASISSDTNVGKNMGNFTAVGEIGRVALPPIALLMAAIIGWRITIAVVGSIGIVLFIIARFYTQHRDVYNLSSKKATPENHKEFLKHTFSLMRNKKAALVASAAVIDSIASSPIYVYLPFLLIAKGNTAIALSIAMGGFFVGSLVGKSILGRLADTYGHKNIFVISELCMAVSLICITFANEFLLLTFFAALLGIFTKGTSPVVQTMFSQLTKKNHYHKIFAVSELFITMAAVISISIIGFAADRMGISIVFYSAALFGILACVPIIISNLKSQR